ncbi:MAG: hypothetical protein ACREJ2_07995 [Planctomycetota bacterium]
MQLSEKNAWILTGVLAALFLGGYLFHDRGAYKAAAEHRAAAQHVDQQIRKDWVHDSATAKPLPQVDTEIENRKTQAFDDVNQLFNVPLAYQHVPSGVNASTYFFNLVDQLKRNPQTKGLITDTKLLGFDRIDPENKYPVAIKLRHLAVVDRLVRAAGDSNLVEISSIEQMAAQEVLPGADSGGVGLGMDRSGRRPTLGMDTAAAAPGGATAGAAGGAPVRLVRVVMTMKFRGREADILHFLAQIQAPTKDPTALTMVYLNAASVTSNDKTFGTLDGQIAVSAIFPLQGNDLKSVLATPNQSILK